MSAPNYEPRFCFMTRLSISLTSGWKEYLILDIPLSFIFVLNFGFVYFMKHNALEYYYFFINLLFQPLSFSLSLSLHTHTSWSVFVAGEHEPLTTSDGKHGKAKTNCGSEKLGLLCYLEIEWRSEVTLGLKINSSSRYLSLIIHFYFS